MEMEITALQVQLSLFTCLLIKLLCSLQFPFTRAQIKTPETSSSLFTALNEAIKMKENHFLNFNSQTQALHRVLLVKKRERERTKHFIFMPNSHVEKVLVFFFSRRINKYTKHCERKFVSRRSPG
jgi:hypothetical protein